MAKVTLTDLGSLTGLSGSAVTAINNNNAELEEALENTLSRDGASPNAMNADLDLNDNDLLNVNIGQFNEVIINGVPIDQLVGSGVGNTIDIRNYGAVGDGVFDDTVAIQSALTAAATSPTRKVLIPSGTYKVSSTITVPSGVNLEGEGMISSKLIGSITNGTPILKVANPSTFNRLANFSVEGATLNFTNWLAGTADPSNAIGIEIYQGGSTNYSARFEIENVRCSALTKGWNIRGFIGVMSNIWATSCVLGFDGELLNAVTLSLRLENNRRDFTITDSDGLHLDNLLAEGACIGSAVAASTIDDCNGLVMTTPYFEATSSAPRSVPFLVIGGTTLCVATKINGAVIVGGAGFDYGVYPLEVDRVQGFHIDGWVGSGSQHRALKTTTNTKGFTNYLVQQTTTWLTDLNKNLGPVVNYFPNKHFDAWLRGFGNVAPSNATLSKETTIVRRGLNALKISATAGTTYNVITVTVTEPSIVAALKGKTVRVGMWVWIPSITEYLEETVGRSRPGITLVSYNGTTYGTFSNTANNHTVAGDWNYIHAVTTFQTDMIRYEISLYANHINQNATGNEYIIVDEITLVDSSTSLEDQMNGRFIDSGYLPTIRNGRMEQYLSALPTDVDQLFEPGDIVWNSAPSASTSPGWICVTAGTGGTAVWKTMAALGA